MKKLKILYGIFIGLLIIAFADQCAPSKNILEESGAQLWGENCNRCHNAPPKDHYNKDQWEVVGLHMQVRANLTNQEVDKIIGFLKGESL